VIIDTQGPKIIGITFDTKHGVFDISYQDNVGLNPGSLVNSAAYTIGKGGKRGLPPTAIANITPGGPSAGVQTIAVTIGNGKKIAPNKYLLTVNSLNVRDIAGNALTGTFNGTFPTGGAQGSTFQATYTLKSNRSVKVTALGVAHPTGKAVHPLVAASTHGAGPKAVHPALHVGKAHGH
jgi:hypothetical protein